MRSRKAHCMDCFRDGSLGTEIAPHLLLAEKKSVQACCSVLPHVNCANPTLSGEAGVIWRTLLARVGAVLVWRAPPAQERKMSDPSSGALEDRDGGQATRL